MSRWLLGAASILLASTYSVSAGAATPQSQFAVEEGGRATCQQFLAARQAKNGAQFGRMMGFIEGYLTAANRYEPNTFDLTPWQNVPALSLIMQAHCRRTGTDSLVMVAQKLVEAFRPYRLTSYSNLIEVGTGQQRALAYEAVIQRAQQELSKRGLYRGPTDGRFSPTMRTALVQFQSTAKLSQTGLPDPATLWVLLNP